MNHPDVERTIRTGYPQGEPNYPHCPVCDAECDEVYMDVNNIIFGCDECTRVKSAWDTEECF